MKLAPVSWYERKQVPKIPNVTVYVSKNGDQHFPEEMASDHIVNALNKLIREKQNHLQWSAILAPDTIARDHYEQKAYDIWYLRAWILARYPVTAEMESVFVRRYNFLLGKK